MRKNYLMVLLIFGTLISIKSNAQLTSTFDDLTLDENSFWNGSDGAGGFTSGQATFLNDFNADWASWSGFAYSNITDNTTAGWENQYSAIAGIGALESANYGVCYAGSSDTISFDRPKDLFGMYVTNATYAALSIQYGDAFAKKFGGETGADPDWFKLTIIAFSEVNQVSSTVDFFLADYRFENNEEDYIVDDWQWLDLSSIKQVSSLTFELSSSDNGDWGMNTPGYFCLDNLTINELTDISFTVTDGSTALDGVTIDFAGAQLTTDIYGLVSFTSVSPTTEMAVTASKDGFESFTSTLNGFLVENMEITLIPTGLESNNQLEYKVFPNPATDFINIQSSGYINAISIYSLSGHLLISEHVSALNSTKINVSELPLGVYILKVETASGINYKQIIKE